MPGEADPARPGVLAEWEAVIGSPPPAYLSVGLMQRAIAHERQCRAQGGVSAATRRALRQISEGKTAEEASPQRLSPGAHLVRDWNGRRYQVVVTDKGFEMDGRAWRSLSSIAKHITGATWSGPRFFGLRGRGGT